MIKESNLNPEPVTQPEMQLIHRGVWASHLANGQELPLGGSIFSNELTTKLKLDFEAFDEQTTNFTETNVKDAYEKNRDKVVEWLDKVGSDVDPYTYFVCFQIQQKMEKLLEVDPEKPTNSFERQQIYAKDESPKLSELKGKSECGERAALGQYLLQKVGIDSTYMSGITMQDAKDDEEFPADHSFIVLKNPAKLESTLIFDIARPRSSSNVPRILETDVAMTLDLLRDKDDLLVGATEVLQGGRLWFGVGEPVAGRHETT